MYLCSLKYKLFFTYFAYLYCLFNTVVVFFAGFEAEIAK